MKSVNSTKFTLAGTMCIYGTIGIFVHYIPLPSAFTAMIRGFVGAAFLLLLLCIKGQRLSRTALKDNFPVLFVSGIMLGVDWILIFEAYRYASVSLATLFHYLAPVIIVAASPFVFKEKMTGKKAELVSSYTDGGPDKGGVTNKTKGWRRWRGSGS